MHLYLIRHGQSYVNLRTWNNGNSDEGLTELGQRQAAALAEWLPGKLPQIDVLYASTMKRAMETAGHLSAVYGLPIQPDDRLREIGNNRHDHTPWPSDDLPEYGDYWGSERPFSSITPERNGGESVMHFRVRVGAFLEDIIKKHSGHVVIVVCHGGVIEFTYDHVFNVGPFRHCEVWTNNTGITRLKYVEHPGRERWRLYYHSRTEHLREVEEPEPAVNEVPAAESGD
jgi:broad specificity phosphatase PhoE